MSKIVLSIEGTPFCGPEGMPRYSATVPDPTALIDAAIADLQLLKESLTNRPLESDARKTNSEGMWGGYAYACDIEFVK